MDYVGWCDGLCVHLAEYAEAQPSHYVHLRMFAVDFLERMQLPAIEDSIESILLTCASIFRTLELDDRSPRIKISYEGIELLRSDYQRWQAAYAIDVSDTELILLGVLNHLSILESKGIFSSRRVDVMEILSNPEVAALSSPLTFSHALEIFKSLEARTLVKTAYFGNPSFVLITCSGAVRVSRNQVVADAEIDRLRVLGESETLDYKRQINIGSPCEKAEFAKDTLVFANGTGSMKWLLVGLENNGEFTTPANPQVHLEGIMALKETTLQQIVSERTFQPPSIRISARGIHRNGPYALIEVNPNIGHLPYRFFADPRDSKLPGASKRGEVWIRAGTTKRLATKDEIAALESRAALYRKNFPGVI